MVSLKERETPQFNSSDLMVNFVGALQAEGIISQELGKRFVKPFLSALSRYSRFPGHKEELYIDAFGSTVTYLQKRGSLQTFSQDIYRKADEFTAQYYA